MSSNINLYTDIEKAKAADEGYIYLKKNHKSFEIIPLKNLFGAIQDIGDVSLSKSGVPNEIITHIDLSLEVPNVTYKEDGGLVYYSPFGGDSKEHVLTIIKLFNRLPSMNIKIYISNKIYDFVKGFSNSNINFFCYRIPKELSIEANKVITHGYSARSFIKQKIPTIIVGVNGLGGWITPDNINYLLKDNFKGRPSGNYNEYIPLEILVDEFTEIKEENNLNVILNKNASIIRNYTKSLTNSNRKEDFINKQSKLYNYLNDKIKRLKLIPKLASNVYLIEKEGVTAILREHINNILFSVPESDLEFLEDLKTNISCKILKEKYEMTDDEFWDIMIPLWERKAIIFCHEI